MAAHLRHAHQIVLCGSPGFVYAALDTLQAGGVLAEQTRSDVFAYAPRT